MSNTSIVVCGQKFDIGTRVVLWDEPGGLNAYDESAYHMTDRKTGKVITNVGKRYGVRSLLHPNPTLDQLKGMITQYVFHHTGNRNALSTYETLHLERRLSVTFIIDDNPAANKSGTVIYQTLDVKEKAWQAGANNKMSIGMEICSRADASLYPNDYDDYHQKQYHVLPRRKRYDFAQNRMVLGYEYNDAQYDAIIRLVTKIGQIFPNLANADFPRTADGRVIGSLLPQPLKYVGYVCHYNIDIHKWDPVSFDHQRLLEGVKAGGVDPGSTFMTFETDGKKQAALTKLGYDVSNFVQAVKKFQSDNGLGADGAWGPKTTYMMDVALKAKGLKV